MRRYPWLALSLLAVAGVLLLGLFPVRAYLDQLDQRQELAHRIETLSDRNRALAEQAAVLESDEAIERLARARYHLVRPGEEAYAILPVDPPPAEVAKDVPPAPSPRASWWARLWAGITSLF